MSTPMQALEEIYHKNPKATIIGGGAVGIGALYVMSRRKPSTIPAKTTTANPVAGTTAIDTNTGQSNGVLGWVGNGAQGVQGPPGVPAPAPIPPPVVKPPATHPDGVGWWKGEPLYNLHLSAPASVSDSSHCPAGYHLAPEVGGSGNWVCRPNRGALGTNDVQVLPGQGGPYAADHAKPLGFQPFGGTDGFRPITPFLPREHTIQAGETLASVGRRYYGRSDAGARFLPQIDGEALQAGQTVRLW